MSVPADLLELRDRADAARRAAGLKAPSDTDDPFLRLIAKIERLEGEEFLAAIDSLMGATPAGRGTVLRLNSPNRVRVDVNAER